MSDELHVVVWSHMWLCSKWMELSMFYGERATYEDGLQSRIGFIEEDVFSFMPEDLQEPSSDRARAV